MKWIGIGTGQNHRESDFQTAPDSWEALQITKYEDEPSDARKSPVGREFES